MQSADPGSCIPQCIWAVQARNLDKKVHSILAPNLAGFVAYNLQSSIRKLVICVAEVISSVYMSVLLLKIKNCVVKSKTMFFMYTCIFPLSKIAKYSKCFICIRSILVHLFVFLSWD